MLAKFSLIFAMLFLIAGNAAAANSEWALGEHIRARLVAEDNRFGVEMELQNGWHTYYKDPGDAGVETTFKWNGSKDIKVKEVQFPPYKIISEYEMKTNAYENHVFFPVKAEFDTNPHVELKIEGAACKDICIPYALNIITDLPQNYGNKASASKEDLSGSYLAIIWTAFIAGLVLNIMPCVLPVLSLKVLGVVRQTGVEKKRARVNFLATAAGIIVSFWVLAGITVGLKATGMAVGWGLHFQSPIFVGILMVIVLVFAVSLLGFFHLKPPSWIAGSGENNTITGNFFSGVLATLLGTSCTAPILVTAVGFALIGSYFDVFLIFTVMGIGMSLPFLLFALRPQMANLLPKPGGWMIRIKHFMGVLLILTAVWLGYVLYMQVAPAPAQKSQVAEDGWVQFDEAEIAKDVAAGKTVFVDISAAWCVNCKVNEKAVLDTDEIIAFFKQPNLVLMRGDMTKPSNVLINYIKKYNRFGIPFNMVYGPNASEGILLPALLTKHEVREAVDKASGANK